MGWSTIPKVIRSVKIAKNLKSRRETFESMTGAVDKQYKKSGVKITSEGQKTVTQVRNDASAALIKAASFNYKEGIKTALKKMKDIK